LEGSICHCPVRSSFFPVGGRFTDPITCDSVPILLSIAALTLIFGQDHPAGDWSQRHKLSTTSPAGCPAAYTDPIPSVQDEKVKDEKRHSDPKTGVQGNVQVYYVGDGGQHDIEANANPTLDVAVNEPLTVESAAGIVLSPLTWLPALGYLTTFGLELTIDGQMANILFALFSHTKGFDQNKAGYYTSIL
jgi:MFS transporter, NNP family, nitrate/nitrite transporter